MENVQRNWEFVTLKETYQNLEAIIDYINLNEKVSIDFVVVKCNNY